MFDARKYFTHADVLLDACTSYSTVLLRERTIEPNYEKWNWIFWRVEIKFETGHRLSILEIHNKIKQNHLRNLKYNLLDGNSDIVFRVDTHGRKIPFGDPCHIHFGSRPFKDDDPGLRGTSLRVGAEELFEWVNRVIAGEALPWQL